ncbi:MAG: DUF2802 domain-containing protein [Bdellovibrionaceae bacterium]|nr:DUF2802 domain-containing protein [Pseudobdellovibrionaceae bacterium]
MNYWLLTLSLMNVLLFSFILFSWVTKNKGKVEDQRLTKGLQLLQNKISILQDLSDKSDEQVRRWVHLIEQKSHEVQNQLTLSDDKIIQIESALSKALDVSKIFYEQVPHAEMADRQKTSKYVQAAKLANQGFTTEQICQKIDLSPAEIEMISKMNREHLQFSEESLPAWVQDPTAELSADQRLQEVDDFTSQLKKMNQMVSATAFDVKAPDMTSMDSIKQQFNDSLSYNSTQIPQTFLDEKKAAQATKTPDGKTIKPFEFRKIVVNKS